MPNPVKARRNEFMRMDRCRGKTYRQIAGIYGVALGTAFNVTRHVQVQFPNRWHRARQREEPMPPCTNVHALLAPR